MFRFMVNLFLNSVKTQFSYYKSLGEKTFDQLEDQDIFWQFNPESNSIAVLVNHLWGNMLSRWTDFLNSDGKKDWRESVLEFEGGIKSKEYLIERLELPFKNSQYF